MSSHNFSGSIERDLNSLVPSEGPADVSRAAEQAIVERLLSTLQPVRPMPSRTMLILAFLGIFASVTAVFVVLIGTRGAENMTVLQLAGILYAVLVTALLTSFSLSGDMSPGQHRVIHPTALIAGSLLIFLGLTVEFFPWGAGSLEVGEAWHCFRGGFLCSLPAAALVLLVIRKGAPLAWGVAGATAGLLGGLVGMAAIHVGCPLVNAPHMTAGHLTIPLAGAIVGYLVGKILPYLLPRRNAV